MIAPVRRFAPLLVAAVLLPAPASAQLGGLIKKQVDKKVENKVVEATAEPPKFDNETLELTGERLDKLIKAREAARTFLEGPYGPEALRKQLEPIEERRSRMYDQRVKAINAWDARRMEIERCQADSLSERSDRKRADFERRMQSDPALLAKMMQLGQAYARAQQNNDAAEMLRIQKEMLGPQGPSAQDSAEVMRVCGDSKRVPPDVAEYLTLDQQVQRLQSEITKAEQLAWENQTKNTDMNQRQLAIACDRIKMYLERLKKKMAQTGMSPLELEELQKRADKLEKLCP